MPIPHDPARRRALTLLGGLAATGLLPPGLLPRPLLAAQDDPGRLVLGPEEPFSFEGLKETARKAAAAPWQEALSPHAAILDSIGYDAFQAIRFRPDHAAWADGKGGDPLQLFHLGRFFQEPCAIWLLEDGMAREIHYRSTYFDMPESHVARTLPGDIGFSGFRVALPGQERDWMAFLGASYFRTAGARGQYGLSTRGLAVDTGLSRPEEFPRFSAFWLGRVAGEEGRVIVHARLDSPSITGAYRMDCRRLDLGITMDVECALYPRKAIERLGIAPLTSMFWYSETHRRKGIDWRPEIHDSDGLAIWTGAGERIWRPLKNPPRVMTNAFRDENPKGFGLLQRDRDFRSYQDDGVFYERRPSVWVEPKGNWGRGHVLLLEIPTDDEIHDNIGAFWVPEEAVRPGRPLHLAYRLYWDGDVPQSRELGHAVAVYAGAGGIPGRPRPPGVTRFVIDFEGDALAGMRRGEVEAVVSLSDGEPGLTDAYPVVGVPGRIRAFFEVTAEGAGPVDMRLYLRGKGLRQGAGALSETWLYQYFPNDEGF